MRKTPLRRAIERLEADGWTVEKVRHLRGYRRRMYRPFGFADLLCIAPGRILAVLVADTRDGNASAELRTASELPAVRDWIAAGADVELWTWRKHQGAWQAIRLSLREEVGGIRSLSSTSGR